ncbi:MAG: S49 family peptidase, partial [Alistipes sp.]|nr:S49 family peptidase [Alistipes sp.]
MKFFKVFLAALLAVLVSGIISSLMWVIIFVGLAGSMEQTTKAVITPQTIVKIDFAENITEAPTKNPLAGFDYATMTMAKSAHLLKVLQSIEKAKSDERVKGLYLNFTGAGGITTGALEELRAAIVDFKQSGKFVVAYNEGYSQGTMYLASVADKIYLHPEGGFSWAGMAQTSIFFKGALDKLGLNAEAIRPTVCKYKSAVEPYIRKEMSKENKAQMQTMVDDFWGVLVGAIAESRSLDAKKLMQLADKLEVTQPEDALKHGLVDALIYEDEMDAKFAEYGVEKGADGEYNIISLGDYMALAPATLNITAPAVGIVYAEGQIFDGAGEDDNIYSANLVEVLKKARKDKDIKSVVLRVNSPGGSAL